MNRNQMIAAFDDSTDEQFDTRMIAVGLATVIPLIEADLREQLAGEIAAIPTADPRYDGSINRHPLDMIHDALTIVRGATADTEGSES